MILFLEDWGRYPDAIPDMKTSNRSFIRQAQLYASMGIRNNAFMLALHNPQLQGVDPYSPDLTPQQMAMIIRECNNNPWYVLREILRLPPKGGPDPTPYRANRSLISMWWSYFNHISFGLTQPRQTGKSVGVNGIGSTVLGIIGRNCGFFLLTKDAQLRGENVDAIKASLELLPDYLNPLTRHDADNKETITVKRHGKNRMLTGVGQPSKDRADKAARGLTLENLLVDEAPYVDNFHISYPVMVGSTSAAIENARESGSPHGTLIYTTAGRLDTDEGRFVYDMFTKAYQWNEILFDCKNLQATIAHILANSSSKSPMIYANFNHRQVGKTDEWLVEQLAKAQGTRENAEKDYLGVWPTGGSGSAIDPKDLRHIIDSEDPPRFTEVTSENYELLWYYDQASRTGFLERDMHVIGLDTSNAIGIDNCGLVMLNSRTGETAMSAAINETILSKFARWLVRFMIANPKTILIIENKASAQVIIDIIIETMWEAGINPFRRIFNYLASERENHLQAQETINGDVRYITSRFLDQNHKYFGFQTTGKTRSFLYDQVLNYASKSLSNTVRDVKLIHELKGLRVKNGRVDHPANGHDDRVIAWLLATYFLGFSRNLQFYGVNPATTLTMVKRGDGDDLAQKRQQQIIRLREELDFLKDMLRNTRHVPEEMLLIRRMKKVDDEMSRLDVVDLSIDDVISSIKKEKKNHKSSYRWQRRAA